ncbi:MAG: GDP-mannose 4,6-dehydratase [Verrucomicrobiia bacterium]
MSSKNKPRALITGITGQDGSYLAELLLENGYEVHGIVRRTSTLIRSRIDHLYHNTNIYNKTLFLHYADLDDPNTIRRALIKSEPDEIYHLAGQSHVGISFEMPELTCEQIAMGTLRFLELIRDLPKPAKFFHATSSEIYGIPSQFPQDEQTPMLPVSPYGCAKAFSTQMIRVYRMAFKVFAVNGIMFNHESTRRGENFVTRKICRAAAAIKLGLQNELALGNLDAQRDWGYAKDYVRGMWLALQYEKPEDFVFATGELHSVKDIVQIAFGYLNLDWQKYVKQDPRLFRPVDPEKLVGNCQKAKKLLGWQPTMDFKSMIIEMTEFELKLLSSNPQ